MIARQMTASRRNPIASMRRSSRMGGGDGMSAIADRLEMDLVTPPALDQAPAHARSSERLRSEEHTSELQSLMRISYAVFCLKTQIPYTNLQNHPPRDTSTHRITTIINPRY